METNNSSNEGQNNSPKLTPAQLFKKHMNDPNHVVTEDELKKLVVGEEAMDTNVLGKEATDKKDELDNLPHNTDLPNPFSILSS